VEELGTVISTFEGPTTKKFSFVIHKEKPVRKGQFIQLNVEDGKLIARVADIRKTNRYFMNPESVNNIESSKPMLESYPTWEWEYLVADVVSVGIFDGKSFQDCRFPPSPGERVFEPERDILERFFGFDSNGLNIGELMHHNIPVRLNLTRLLQKHLSILALSGAGKSHLASTLIEELLDRPKDKGKLAVVIIDTHGEYVSFADDSNYAAKTRVFPSSEMRIGLPNLSHYQIGSYTQLTSVQSRKLSKILKRMKGKYSIDDVARAIESDENMNVKTKEVLIGVMDDLRSTGLFGVEDYPGMGELVRPGQLSVIDLSETVNMKKKQIIVSYISSKLFHSRRNGIIPPLFLIIEEAHQYAPEKASRENAISRGILQTIAREGRKFHISLCLISQRPVHLSTTILSQCNSQIILRVTNPYDLDHIGKSSEGIRRDVLDQISSLRVGSGLIIGEAVNFPLFVNIRRRKSKESDKAVALEKAALEWSKRMKKKEDDAKSFM
jgi:hypothetical protein